jgi:KipI family sensor histidine kinase inhibitor
VACAFGDDAIYLDLGELAASERARRTLAVAGALRQRFASAEVVVGAGAIAVHGVAPTADALDAAVHAAQQLDVHQAGIDADAGRLHHVAVVYDGADLDEVAARAGMPPAEVIRLHASGHYRVELVGFLPGFGYLGPLDPKLQLPRRPSPRPSVPARSVAIAGAFTGIYPAASPGGWHLLGRALDFVAFDPHRAEPSLLSPGDRVRFVPAAADAVRHAETAAAPPPAAEPPADTGATLEIVAAAPGVTVQDRGRRALSRGVPPSGPLDADSYAAANAAVGNVAGAAALEVVLGRLQIVVRGGDAVVSIDGARARMLAAGESLVVEPGSVAVRYLAVRGGLDVPVVLGSRATLVSAKLGGVQGRALRAGDHLAVGAETLGEPPPNDLGAALDPSAGTSEVALLEIVRGPQLDRFPTSALQTLTAATWRVSRLGDRVGVRLEGAAVPREGSDSALPVPMVRGAVQVATDGTPIVLGPDHPVTGGYPVLAVLRKDAQSVLARLRPGTPLRFRLG